MDHNTGNNKGYGFIKYEHSHEAATAIAKMNGILLQGKTLVVKLADPEGFQIQTKEEQQQNALANPKKSTNSNCSSTNDESLHFATTS